MTQLTAVSTTLIQAGLWRAARVSNGWGIWTADGKPLGDPSKFTGIAEAAAQLVGTYGLGTAAQLSTTSVSYSKTMKVSDFPVEKGGFASYNKVELPAEPVVQLCFMGSDSEKSIFLDELDTACKSTNLYTVVTPEVNYVDHTIESYSYQRTSAKGANLLFVEVTLKEVRQVSSQNELGVGVPNTCVALKEMGMLQSKLAQTALNAAIIAFYNGIVKA